MQLYEQAIDQCREGGWAFELCVFHEYAGALLCSFGTQECCLRFNQEIRGSLHESWCLW